MTRTEIADKLRAVMKTTTREKVQWESVTEQTPIQSLGFDSLSLLDLIYDVQQEFGIQFEAEEMIGIKTVGDLISWLEPRIAS